MAQQDMVLNSLEQTYIDNEYLEYLRQRANRCCCKYCGESLEIKKLTYSNCEMARLELYCSGCGRIEFGTEKEIFIRARYMIKEMQLDYYSDLANCEQKKQMNIAKVCEIVDWMLKDMGLLTEKGFCDVKIKDAVEHDSCTFDDTEVL